MNLPSGKTLKINLDASSTDLVALIDELRRKRFCGYLAITTKGQTGIEEGTVLIDTGKVVGTTYAYFAFNKELSGERAFQRVLNAASNKTGVIDVIELSAEQVHLALAFHEDAVFVPSDESLRHIKLPSYSPFFEDEVRKEIQNASSTGDESGRKYKMYDLTKPGYKAGGLPEGQAP